jgi:hypothetical protein
VKDGPPDFEDLAADAEWRRALNDDGGFCCVMAGMKMGHDEDCIKAGRASTLRIIAQHFEYWTNHDDWAAFLRAEAERVEGE